VRVLVCRCSIGYAGRLTTRLASGDRVVLFKEDGSVAVHALKGAKPINYMAGPTSVREDDDVIRIYRPASDETLTIVVEHVHHDQRHGLVDSAVLEREGQERELHEHLARAPHLIEAGLAVVERERLTDVGPVDLWCRDAAGRVTLVEVKRVRAVAAAVDQVVRYREQALRNESLGGVRALVVAPDFAPQARVMAAARDVECIVLDVPRLLAEAGPDDLTLFA
jgi:endonuclease